MASDSLVVGSKVKAFIKAQGCHTSGEFLEALNNDLQETLKKACSRCQGNKRSTVKAQDL